MIAPGVNGFLFDSREIAIEYIEYLKNDATQYKLLSVKSRMMYERHFNNYRCAIDYEQLYTGKTRIRPRMFVHEDVQTQNGDAQPGLAVNDQSTA